MDWMVEVHETCVAWSADAKFFRYTNTPTHKCEPRSVFARTRAQPTPQRQEVWPQTGHEAVDARVCASIDEFEKSEQQKGWWKILSRRSFDEGQVLGRMKLPISKRWTRSCVSTPEEKNPGFFL